MSGTCFVIFLEPVLGNPWNLFWDIPGTCFGVAKQVPRTKAKHQLKHQFQDPETGLAHIPPKAVSGPQNCFQIPKSDI